MKRATGPPMWPLAPKISTLPADVVITISRITSARRLGAGAPSGCPASDHLGVARARGHGSVHHVIDVRRRNTRYGLVHLARVTDDVIGQDGVGEVAERVVGTEWLLAENVQGRTRNPPLLDLTAQFRFINQFTPGGIDANASWLELAQ